MCGRYYIDPESEELAIKKIIREVNERFRNTPQLAQMKTGEIYPTDIVPVLTSESPVLMKWGFTRFEGKGQVINARLETASKKPMFSKSLARHRCLVPASCFFEWKKQERKKQKYAIGLQNTLFMAGLYRFEKDRSIPSFVILTRPAAPGIAFIHHRMPVILAPDTHKNWLRGSIDTRETMELSLENLVYQDIN
jgi:putative SOS response-associated peptidase YedK